MQALHGELQYWVHHGTKAQFCHHFCSMVEFVTIENCDGETKALGLWDKVCPLHFSIDHGSEKVSHSIKVVWCSKVVVVVDLLL